MLQGLFMVLFVYAGKGILNLIYWKRENKNPDSGALCAVLMLFVFGWCAFLVSLFFSFNIWRFLALFPLPLACVIWGLIVRKKYPRTAEEEISDIIKNLYESRNCTLESNSDIPALYWKLYKNDISLSEKQRLCESFLRISTVIIATGNKGKYKIESDCGFDKLNGYLIYDTDNKSIDEFTVFLSKYTEYIVEINDNQEILCIEAKVASKNKKK